MATTKVGTNGSRLADLNGKSKAAEPPERRAIHIPGLDQGEFLLTIVGDRPLMVNNKLNVAEEISEQYSGKGKAGTVKKARKSDDECYVKAFYVMPDTKFPPPSPKGAYGIPASGIKKCACKAIRTTGITDNTTIGLISNSFWVMENAGGLCRLKFERLERDIRAVNIGSGSKTVPQMRHRPIFHGWSVDLRIKFNRKIIGEEQIVNLFLHAGQYVGLCEMRAEKRQGQCGGFVVRVVE